MPLLALLGGNRMYARNLGEEDRSKDYHCPICEDQMLLVLPTRDIIKHFRHKSGTQHKPESPEHLEMKEALFKFFEADPKWTPQLEVPISDDPKAPFEQGTYNVADVLVRSNDAKRLGFVFECQCSHISEESFLERERRYSDKGLMTVWVFGGAYLTKANHDAHGFFVLGRVRTVVEEHSRERPPGLLFYYHKGMFLREVFRKDLFTLQKCPLESIMVAVRAHLRWGHLETLGLKENSEYTEYILSCITKCSVYKKGPRYMLQAPRGQMFSDFLRHRIHARLVLSGLWSLPANDEGEFLLTSMSLEVPTEDKTVAFSIDSLFEPTDHPAPDPSPYPPDEKEGED